jgi:hypothetical protein
MGDGRPPYRNIQMPLHRFAPLKQSWSEIYTPVYEHMKVVICMLLKVSTLARFALGSSNQTAFDSISGRSMPVAAFASGMIDWINGSEYVTWLYSLAGMHHHSKLSRYLPKQSVSHQDKLMALRKPEKLSDASFRHMSWTTTSTLLVQVPTNMVHPHTDFVLSLV